MMLFRDIMTLITHDPSYGRDITRKSKIRLYGITAILTFGYSATFYPNVQAGGDFTVLSSFFSGMFWPLFWSWEFFSWFN